MAEKLLCQLSNESGSRRKNLCKSYGIPESLPEAFQVMIVTNLITVKLQEKFEYTVLKTAPQQP